MPIGTAGFTKVIDGSTVNATATVYSAWYDMSDNYGYVSVWAYGDSAGGTSHLDTYADISPQSCEGIASTSTDTTFYASVKLDTSEISSDGVLNLYKLDLGSYFPIHSLRIRIVGGASNPADTKATVWLGRFSF